jgi:hypothetical protein
MRRIFTILAAVLMVGTFAYAQTAPAGQTEKPKAAKSATTKAPTAHGAIVKADATTVTLKTKAGEENFAINADTKITQSGKAITAADLKAGETATVSYTKAGEQMTATKIAVAAAKATKTEKAPKEPKK